MIEVVGCIILPTGQTKDLLKLKLVEKLKLEIIPLKNRCVSLGADTTARAAGEIRPLTMTLRPSCSHKSRYTVIELGDHDIILG